MIKKWVVLFFLVASNFSWAKECFDFENIILADKSEAEVIEELSKFEDLVAKFFNLKSEGEVTSEIPWSVARELARFLEQGGLDVRVREDFYNAEKESFFIMISGTTLIGGYFVGAYIEPYIEKVLIKINLTKKVMLATTLLWRTGFMMAAWFGGRNLFETNCDLLLPASLLEKAVPLVDFKFDEETIFP